MGSTRALELRTVAGLLKTGLLLVLPLIFYRGFTGQFSTIKSFLFKILLDVGLMAWAFGMIWGKLSWPKGFRLSLPLALLSLVVVSSSLSSPVPAFTLREVGYFLCGPGWVLLLVSWNRGEGAVRSVSTLAAVAATAVAAIGVSQWSGHDPLLAGGYQIEWGTMVPRMRLYSTFGNPNFVGGYLIGAIFLALALAWASKSLWARAAWLVSTCLMLASIIGTGSKGAWGGLVAGLLVAGLVWTRRETSLVLNKGVNRQVSIGTGIIFASALSIPATLSIVVLALITQGWGLVSLAQGRWYLYQIGWAMFREHPVLGSGWGTFPLHFLDAQAGFLSGHPHLAGHWTNLRHLHNDPLQLLIEAGLVGFAAFTWVLWTYGREVGAIPNSPRDNSARVWLGASAGGVMAILADSLVNFQFAVPPTFVLLFTLLSFPSILSAADDACGKPTGRASTSASTRARLAIRVALSLLVLLGVGFVIRQLIGRATAERDYALGRRYEDRGEVALAEDTYRHGTAMYALNGRLHYGLARVLYLRGKYAEALGEVVLAERTHRDPHLEVLKARIQDQMGMAQAAVATYRRALALDPTLKTVQADIDRLERP